MIKLISEKDASSFNWELEKHKNHGYSVYGKLKTNVVANVLTFSILVKKIDE